jgi:hypothetical protein
MYTYSPMRYLARVQALTWGRHCDGFVAFSNETLPDLGMFQWNTNHSNDRTQEENYSNMWQKSVRMSVENSDGKQRRLVTHPFHPSHPFLSISQRYIWKYAYDHFLNDYDYFYISGDDVYLMVDNFREYLQELYDQDLHSSTPRHIGSWLPNRDMIAGGPGYSLNRAALQQWIESPSRHGWDQCYASLRDSKEDWLISRCLSWMGIRGNATDTRDVMTGEQRFHDACPATLYLFRADPNSRAYFKRQAAAWENQPLPNNSSRVVGPKHGLDAAAKHSISFHRIHYPIYTARIHAILQMSHDLRNDNQGTSLCPTDSPLSQGLLQHFANMTRIN